MSVSVDPNFKSTLPPRKRAKTQEEKEQRRMERILRNRRAAQALRERKRLHFESMEAYVLALERNYSILMRNIEKLSAGASSSLLTSLEQPQDLTEVKANIPASSGCLALISAVSPCSSSDSNGQVPSFPSDGDMSDHEQPEVKLEPLSPALVSEKTVDQLHLCSTGSGAPDYMGNTTNYYSFLSPVSLHSPLDLTLKQEPQSGLPSLPGLEFDHNETVPLPASRLDYLAQNSEVILFPRAISA